MRCIIKDFTHQNSEGKCGCVTIKSIHFGKFNQITLLCKHITLIEYICGYYYNKSNKIIEENHMNSIENHAVNCVFKKEMRIVNIMIEFIDKNRKTNKKEFSKIIKKIVKISDIQDCPHDIDFYQDNKINLILYIKELSVFFKTFANFCRNEYEYYIFMMAYSLYIKGLLRLIKHNKYKDFYKTYDPNNKINNEELFYDFIYVIFRNYLIEAECFSKFTFKHFNDMTYSSYLVQIVLDNYYFIIKHKFDNSITTVQEMKLINEIYKNGNNEFNYRPSTDFKQPGTDYVHNRYHIKNFENVINNMHNSGKLKQKINKNSKYYEQGFIIYDKDYNNLDEPENNDIYYKYKSLLHILNMFYILSTLRMQEYTVHDENEYKLVTNGPKFNTGLNKFENLYGSVLTVIKESLELVIDEAFYDLIVLFCVNYCPERYFIISEHRNIVQNNGVTMADAVVSSMVYFITILCKVGNFNEYCKNKQIDYYLSEDKIDFIVSKLCNASNEYGEDYTICENCKYKHKKEQNIKKKKKYYKFRENIKKERNEFENNINMQKNNANKIRKSFYENINVEESNKDNLHELYDAFNGLCNDDIKKNKNRRKKLLDKINKKETMIIADDQSDSSNNESNSEIEKHNLSVSSKTLEKYNDFKNKKKLYNYRCIMKLLQELGFKLHDRIDGSHCILTIMHDTYDFTGVLVYVITHEFMYFYEIKQTISMIEKNFIIN